jgi:transposase
VFEPTGSQRDAASVIFNLPGYRVIEAVDLPLGGCRVKVQPVDLDQGCPECGVVSARVHAWVTQRVRDIPHSGDIEVVVRKRRMVCAEPACQRRTFTPATEQLPPGPIYDPAEDGAAGCSDRFGPGRLRGRQRRVAWWTVQATVNAAAVLLPSVDDLQVRRLGMMSTVTRGSAGSATSAAAGVGRSLDVDDCQCGLWLGVGDCGRPRLRCGQRLAGRAQPDVAGPDPGGGDRPVGHPAAERQDQRGPVPPSAVGEPDADPGAAAAGPGAEQRRGRKIDPAWAHRTLLLRGYDTLSERAKDRLDAVFASDDPTDELSAAWRVKEQLRRLLTTSTVEQAPNQKMILGCYVLAADMDETWRLWAIEDWWPAIEVLIETGVTSARTEAANTGIKHIKRTGRGYRNPTHYQARILLTSAARRAA